MESRASSIHRIGTTIGGRYRLLRVIGSGGMGEVYEAEHRYTLRRVAVKLVHPWIANAYSDGGDRFFGEAQVAARIRHPAIVDVLDAGREDDSTLYLVFELLEGENLEVALRRQRILPRDLVRIGVRVLDALSAIHAHGVVHRDIKPANIFLAKSSYGAARVKLLDFGIARPMENTRWGQTERGGVVGTVDYMSPEQALGEELDGRSDLWATAAVLFRGLSGRPPFVATNPNRVIVRLVTQDPPLIAQLRPDLPPDLAEVIDRALRRPRSERWTSAEDMGQALALCESEALSVAALPAHAEVDRTTQGTQPDPVVEAEDVASLTPAAPSGQPRSRGPDDDRRAIKHDDASGRIDPDRARLNLRAGEPSQRVETPQVTPIESGADRSRFVGQDENGAAGESEGEDGVADRNECVRGDGGGCGPEVKGGPALFETDLGASPGILVTRSDGPLGVPSVEDNGRGFRPPP